MARHGGRRSAFTLIEAIVVVVLLAIIAAVAAPRIAGWGGRTSEAAAEAIAAVVSSAATRDQLGSGKLALDFADGRLSVQSLASTDRGLIWRPDALSPAAEIGEIRLTSVTLDGAPLDASAWQWELPQGERRPVLVIVIGDGPDGYRVELGSFAASAVITPAASSPLPDESTDLDAMGRGDASW
jgi:prepilin-type N-terminal cleavage/methylation domain-containing protein